MINTILGSRYKILEQVGTGGMASVYKAQDIILKRIVAVKVLKEQFVEDDDFLRKFENEAQSAASLNHPNIVNVFDVGSEEINDRKIYYIVMEFLDGKTLKDYILEKGVLSNEEIKNFSKQIAQALVCAHDHNIIHRDIKPQNILINSNGILKVTDFGIARISSDATITYTSSILGTVHYISPEQAKGRFIDEKSDIYSLGIVMYEMATGQVPFEAENAVGIAIKHIQEPVIPPQELNPSLDDCLNNIILTCLKKDSSERFSSAQDLVNVLQKGHHNIGFSDGSETVNGDTTVIRKTSAAEKKENKAVYRSPKRGDPESHNQRKRKKGSILTILLGVLCALIIVAGVFRLVNSQKNSIQPEQEVRLAPNVYMLSEELAIKKIEEEDLVPKVSRKANNEIEKGLVVSQLPESGFELKKGDFVEITVSTGQELTEVPDLLNREESEVQSLLESKNLRLTSTKKDFSETHPEGTVIDQFPKAGEMVAYDTEVSIVVSKGKAVKTVVMPKLVGSTLNEALDILRRNNLDIGKIDNKNDAVVPKDIVMWQSQIEGAEIQQDSIVDLIVSLGPETSLPPTTMPTTSNNNSTETTTPIDEKDPVDNPKTVTHNFTINPPADKEEYTVTINKISDGVSKEIFRQKFSTEQGVQQIKITGEADANYEVYYDGKLMETITN